MVENLLFPLEAVVLSSNAIGEKVSVEYPISILGCRLHYRSIHDTYIVRAKDSNYFFKVYRHGLRTKEDIHTEIHWVLHIKNAGISVGEPVKKIDGNYITEFDTIHGKRYGVLFTSVGIKTFNALEETDALNLKLGKYLALIHKAWNSLNPIECNRKLDIPNIVDASMKHIRAFSDIYPVDVEFLEDVAQKLHKKFRLLSTDLPEYGICHGDVYGGNIRYDHCDNPILFDFDFAGYGWRAYDISLYANAFGLGCSTDGIIKRERRKHSFLDGYTSVQTLSNEAISSIDLMVPFRRIFNIGTIYFSMSNTFGDEWAINNANADIDLLKKWVDLNPVL